MHQDEWIEIPTKPVHTGGSAKKRPLVDFYYVELGHQAIHQRLENWGLWSRSRFTPATAPGFELYRSSDARREYGTPASSAVDREDAQKIARAVAELPVKNAAALSWCYVTRSKPKKMCDHLDVDFAGLYELIKEGRQKLIELSA